MRAHRWVGALATVAVALALAATLAAAPRAGRLDFFESPSSPEAVDSGAVRVATADLDGDGDQDIVVANGSTSETPGGVTILKNNGHGNFFEPASSPEVTHPQLIELAVSDLDGDGDQDIALLDNYFGDVTILKNNGHGNFFEPASSPEDTGPSNQTSMAVADLDGDGDRDIAIVIQSRRRVAILKNNGHGNFFEPASSPEPLGADGRAIAAADLDGDGDQDLATSDSDIDRVTILKNNGHGNFFEPASSPEKVGDQPEELTAADLDGDGDQDLAVATFGPKNVSILANLGSGNFVEPASSPEGVDGVVRDVIAADLDSDTDQDLALITHLNQVAILGNFGAGNFFQPATSPEVVGAPPGGVAAADLDGDADQDLAVANGDVTILEHR